MATCGTGLARSTDAGRVTLPGEIVPVHTSLETYQKPAVQRFGSLRELTLGGGAQLSGDATNLYHRS